MAKKQAVDALLARTSEICLGLPGAEREVAHGHGIFRARKKVFAYYLNNHHGDGIISVCARVLPGDNNQLVESVPARFYLPAYIAHRGWVGYRLDVEPVDWDEVAELVQGSYNLVVKPTGSAGGSRRRR